MNVSDGQAREEYVSEDSREPDLGLRVHRGDSDDAGVDAAPRTGVTFGWQDRPVPWDYDDPDEYKKDIEKFMMEVIWNGTD